MWSAGGGDHGLVEARVVETRSANMEVWADVRRCCGDTRAPTYGDVGDADIGLGGAVWRQYCGCGVLVRKLSAHHLVTPGFNVVGWRHGRPGHWHTFFTLHTV